MNNSWVAQCAITAVPHGLGSGQVFVSVAIIQSSLCLPPLPSPEWGQSKLTQPPTKHGNTLLYLTKHMLSERQANCQAATWHEMLR